MANKKIKMNEKNANGTFNVLHPETSIEQVIDLTTGSNLKDAIGPLNTLSTTQKTVVGAINELASRPSSGGGGGTGITTLPGLSTNPTVDNKAVLLAAFGNASLDSINLPAGTYNISHISVSINNKVIKGVPGKTILRTNGPELLFLQDSSNVIFEDITFSALLDSEENGAVTANNSALKNITFLRCTFTTKGSNGVKFINEAAKISQYITFDSCTFETIGRMGVEFQNHNDSFVASRYNNITFTNCLFKNIGTKIHGMGISMSGYGKWVTIQGCVFHDCWDIGVELIGTNYVTVDKNQFLGETKKFNPINVTNERDNDYIAITNNKTSGNLNQILIYNGKEMVFSGNQIYGLSQVYFKGMNHSKITNNIIRVTTGEVLFFDNAHHNVITNNELDTRTAPENWSVIKFYGYDSTKNQVYNNQLFRSDGGVFIGQTDGATGNEIGENYLQDLKVIGSSEDIKHQSIGRRIHSVSKKTQFTIEIVPTTYWFPFYLDIICMGVENGSGNEFTTKTTVYGISHANIDFTKTDELTHENATITVTKNNNRLTFLCEHKSINEMGHVWSINASTHQQIKIIG